MVGRDVRTATVVTPVEILRAAAARVREHGVEIERPGFSDALADLLDGIAAYTEAHPEAPGPQEPVLAVARALLPPDDEVMVRDSKDPDGPVLVFSPGAWVWFVDEVKADAMGSD